MQLQCVGLNHKQAPVEIREKVGFTPDLLARAYQEVDRIPGQTGVVILSTCNRTELYVAGPAALSDILAYWEVLVGVNRGDFSDYLVWQQNDAAIEHIMRVAAGLDSMVLGEPQILGQVKAAYQLAHAYGAARRLHRIFHYALRLGKRAHSETGISHNALSMGHAVVELTRKVFGDEHPVTALIVGAGEMGALVARYLLDQGVGHLLVANRTYEKSRNLAEKLNAEVLPFENLSDGIRRADVVVSSTSSRQPIITVPMVKEAIRGQSQRLRFFFDLALPRDIAPDVGSLGDGIFLYDLDDVKSVIQANLKQREREVSKVERLIEEEREDLKKELGASEVGLVIRSLREKAETIRQVELAKAMGRLSHLSDEERGVVADTTRLILNKFLNDAMISMRSWGADETKALYIEAVRDLFHLQFEGESNTERQSVTDKVAYENE